MRATFPKVHKLEQLFARGGLLLLGALVSSVSLLVGGQAGIQDAAAAPLWPYTATLTAGPRAGQTVGLVHLDNITMEDIGARVVGAATLHVGVAGSPYQCLDGTSLNVFSFDGQLFVHNGLQGAQCTYGTWEAAPRSLGSPAQVPAIARLAVAANGTANFVATGRNLGLQRGTVSLIGYSATSSGPVYRAKILYWSPTTVSFAANMLPHGSYDVLLLTAAGAAATTLYNYGPPSPAPLWVEEPSPTNQALNAVSCVPGKAPTGVSTGYCYAVGNNGTVLFSSNGGLTWSLEASPTKVDLLGVTCLPLALPRSTPVPVWCWAVGDQGTVLFTKNGLPWTSIPVNPATSNLFSAVACQANGQRCWAVGTAVAAEYEAAGGNGWRLITILGPAGSECGPGGPPNACLRGVAVGNADEHFAVGGGGNIYDQFDYQGQGWSNTVSLGAGYFTSVACGPASGNGHSHCITVGTDDSLAASRIYVTFDSGASWVPATSPAEGALPPLRAVSVLAGAPADGLAWAVGDRGTMIRSGDGGRTWAKEASPTTADLFGLSCPDLAGPRVACVAVGAGGTILVRRSLQTTGSQPRPYLYMNEGGVVDQLFSWPHFPSQLFVQDVTRIVGLHWTSTTPSEAQAQGTFRQSGCNPNCAAGPWSSLPVKLTASQPKNCTVQVMRGTGLTAHPVAERVLVYSRVVQTFTGKAARTPPSVVFSC